MAKTFAFFWVFALLLCNSVLSQFDNFIYSGFHGNLSLNGVAEIENNGIVRLTNETSRLIGRAFYPNPIKFKNSTDGTAFSFSTSFAFAIVPQYPTLGGHGFALTISTNKELPGALPSQYLGLLNNTDNGNVTNHLFAVEFDTVQDFEFQDINDNHVGIDIDSLTSNFSASATYFSDEDSKNQSINLKSGKMIMAWVDYDSVSRLLNVTLSPTSSKPTKPLISYSIDLSPILHDSMYVGFSSSTGLLASSHYLFGWSFKVNGQAQLLDMSSLPSLPRPKKKHTALIIGVSVGSAALMVGAICVSIYIICKIKNADVIEEWELHLGPNRFSYQELKIATKGFKEKELLGIGGFGRVYRGTLPKSKTLVAVKRISHESKQGLREFASEISSMGRLRHRNLVQLQGWCRRRGDLLLVYDYMPNGSLDKYLFDQPKSTLSWEQRLQIIKGVASGLLYLHEEWEQVVIHRDIKASNVLLDGEMNARLGDFGLARLCEHGSNPSTTRVVGTLGYLAPELTRTGKATTSSDVFALGGLLLEVVCGRRPIEVKALPEELILVDWVWEKWKEGCILEVVDPKLMGNYDEVEAVLVLKLGLMCSHCKPTARPSVRQVLSYLQWETRIPEVLSAPGEYEGTDKGDDDVVGFDNFLHSYSYPSSSFEKVSSFSLTPAADEEVGELSIAKANGGR